MKKIIKFVLTACLLMAIALSGAACGGKEMNGGDKPSIYPVSVKLSGYKDRFDKGEAFSTGGLAVELVYSDSESQVLSEAQYTVNSDEFDNGEAGTYLITVTATEANISGVYSVRVGTEKYTDSIKILAIGNSFADDSLQHFYKAAKSYGADKVVLGVLYIGGCTLSTHNTNAKNDAYAYDYRKNEYGSWITTPYTSMLTGIRDEEWDIISLQQASGVSGMPETYNSDLDELVGYVKENSVNPDVKLVWNMTWAYQGNSNHSEFVNYDSDQLTMYEAITGAVENKILTRNDFDAVIPTGTAIQNLRTSFIGDTVTRDGYHLSYTIGRYTAALTWIDALTGWDISKITYVPDDSVIYPAVLDVVRESVGNATASKYEITQSETVVEPQPDLTGLVNIGFSPAAFVYWNSTSTSYNTPQANDGTAKKFVSSGVRFTREEIPVGSILILKDGWQYRPEGWVDDAQQPSATRPVNTTSKYAYVTESWWGDFTLRAFNLSLISNENLGDNYKEGFDALEIYVPLQAVTDPVYPDDSAVFESNGLSFNDYVRKEYVPICGYYNSQTSATALLSTDSYAKNYITTGLLTEAELPVGSVLVLDTGYSFRPEAWKDEEKQSSRPGNVSAGFTKIESSFWNGYIYRAFNIGKSPSAKVSDDPLGTAAHFRIYLPKA